jgi:hypothetical protein
MDLIDQNQMLTIGACDGGYIWDRDKFNDMLLDNSVDFIIWVYHDYPAGKRKPEMYGWVDADENGVVQSVSVKKPVNSPASSEHKKNMVVTGAFTFRRAADFVRSAKRMIERNGRINNEFYVDECCNDAIAFGLKGVLFEVDAFIPWGTPDELRTYEYWHKVFRKWNP